MVITKATAVPESPPNTVQYMPPFPMKVAVAIPSYCRVEGELDRRVGKGGVHYAIGFAVSLPDRWNGRFLFQGGGGFNGSVLPPLGTAAAGDTPALARGFAVVSTDDGHKGTIWDTSFMADQEAALDFANDTVPKVTRTAKAIVAQYYGKPAAHSYFAGCSTGGREGMEASERMPEEYDGIVIGDPAMEVRLASLGQNWFNYQLTQIAPKDASGKPEPDQAFSASDCKLVLDGLMMACDALDGIKDGMIFNVGACHFDPAVLQCQAAKNESCLSAAQVGALKTAFSGPKNSRGQKVYRAFPWDGGITAEGRAPGMLTNAAASFGPKYHETSRCRRHRRQRQCRRHPASHRHGALDRPQQLFRAWRQGALLPRHQRPLFLGARHARLLPAHGQGVGWLRNCARAVEPVLFRARHAALPRRSVA